MRSSHTKRNAGSLESMSAADPSPVVEEILQFEDLQTFRSDRDRQHDDCQTDQHEL
jgi:hypothetical protein